MTTLTAFRVATALYPVLLDVARNGETVTYGALTKKVKARHSADPVIARIIPRSLGSRLLLIRRFTIEQGYPDLSSLVVNARTGEVGEAYSSELDALEQRALVRAFDWESVLPEFDIFIAHAVREIETPKRPRFTRTDAKDKLWCYARQNKNISPMSSRQREAAIKLIMDGASVEDAVGDASAH